MIEKILNRKESIKTDIDTLRLIRTENIGIKTFQSLIKIYGNAGEALRHVSELSLKGGKKTPLKPYSLEDAEKEIESNSKLGARLISYLDEEYPYLLKQIFDFPPVISVKGNISVLARDKVAVVGARNASYNGKVLASKIASALGDASIVSVSGLARGIDTAVHAASLDFGTIGVIAGGIGNIYPPENAKLYDQITEKGVIIAELPALSAPKSQHFPQRNRIISGLASAVVVVEASLNSGSLITARMANEQNREVFAVPGFPLDPRSHGTNNLIKQGAYLIESIEDLISNLPRKTDFNYNDNNEKDFVYVNQIPDEAELQRGRSLVLEHLSSSPVSLDILANQLDLTLPVLYIILLELELAGKIFRSNGNKFSLIY